MDELVELLTGAVERARDLENQRATGGKVAVQAEGNRLAARRRAAGERRHPAIRARGGRAPGHPLAPGLLLHRRQHSALAGHSGHRHRRRRSGRRRPHHPGMVPAGRPRPGPEAHLPDLLLLLRGASAEPAKRRQVSRRPRGRSGAGLEHRHLGRHLRAGESGAGRTFRRSCSWRCASRWPRWRCWCSSAAPARPSARPWKAARRGGRSAPARFLFAGYLFQTLGLRLTTAPKSAFITGLDVGDGTFAGGARL